MYAAIWSGSVSAAQTRVAGASMSMLAVATIPFMGVAYPLRRAHNPC